MDWHYLCISAYVIDHATIYRHHNSIVTLKFYKTLRDVFDFSISINMDIYKDQDLENFTNSWNIHKKENKYI